MVAAATTTAATTTVGTARPSSKLSTIVTRVDKQLTIPRGGGSHSRSSAKYSGTDSTADALSSSSSSDPATLPSPSSHINNNDVDNSRRHQLLRDVIIIGAGPAGLACAVALSGCVENVHLVERHDIMSPDQRLRQRRGSTFGLAYPGQRACQDLHPVLLTTLRRVGITSSTSNPIEEDTASSLVFIWYEFRDCLLQFVNEHCPNVIIHAGYEFDGIKVKEGDDDDGDVDGDQQVCVSIRPATTRLDSSSRDSHQLLFLRGDLVIGADGVHSKVRRCLTERQIDIDSGDDHGRNDDKNYNPLPPLIRTNTTNYRGSLIVDSTCSQRLQALLKVDDGTSRGMVPFSLHRGPGLYFVVFRFHPQKPGRLAWVLATQSRDDANGTTPIDVVRDMLLAGRDRSSSTDDDDAGNDDDDDDDNRYETFLLLKEIFERSPVETMQPYAKTSLVDWRDETILEWKQRESMITGKNNAIKTTTINTTSTSSQRRRRRRIRSIWGGRGRVTLVGDAAHAMRPTDGYGGSMAMEDAAVLVRVIRRRLLRAPEDHQENASTREEGQEQQGTDDEDEIERALNEFEERRFTRAKPVYDNQYERYRQRMEEGKRVGPQDLSFLRWFNRNSELDNISQ